MRIVDKSKTIPTLSELGVVGRIVILQAHLQDPNGIILSTGPTGSGKTTTLYACLTQVNTADVNIVTYEYLVEIKME